MYRIAVIDDEESSIRNVIDIINNNFNKSDFHIKTFTDPDDFIESLEKCGAPFDIAICDICLKDTLGINISKKILSYSPACQVMFITGYPRYATDTYEVDHVYTIIKNELSLRLPLAIKKAISIIEKQSSKTLVLNKSSAQYVIYQDSVLYFERIRRTTQVVLEDQIITVYASLDSIMPQLDPFIFTRCHNSYIINLNKVSIFKKHEFTLCNGKIVPISRPFLASAKDAFTKYIGSTT